MASSGPSSTGQTPTPTSLDTAMKILHIISSGGMYGAEAVILDLSRCLARAGHTSLLGVFGSAAQRNTELEDRAQTQGLETHPIPCTGQLDRSVPARIRELVMATGAQVVHAHGYKADVYAYWALRGTSTPLVSTCHNWIDSDLSLRVYNRFDRALLRRFQGVVAVSDGVRKILLASGVRQERIRLIRNGVDVHGFASVPRNGPPLEHGRCTVGVVARLSHEKGVDLFLEAAAIVAQQLPETRFVIAGDGPDRGTLQALLEELNLKGRAVFLGRQNDMPAFYASLDLLVLPSRMEGLPMAVLEGMASGLPVVATAVGEVPQVVESGQTGLVVAAEDPPALAAAISELVRDAALRERMGSKAKARVTEQFSGDRMAAEYLALYRDITSPANPATA